ncbi:MAG: RNA polymerase sigma-I factor [Desulfocucumaceae bacterium]
MLPEDILQEKLYQIRGGNVTAREELISEHRSFVARACIKVCGRALDWGRDDEISIGLIAFNEAIDRYDEKRGVPFPAFARLIIKSRIMDFLRKQSRHSSGSGASLDDTEGWDKSVLESASAWERYLEETTAREREEEITEYKKLIAQFGITFDDLVKSSPKHRDARTTLLRVSRVLAGDDLMFGQLMSTGKIPVLALTRLAGVHIKIVERGRKYIIATSVIWRHCEELLYLCSFIKPPGKETGLK